MEAEERPNKVRKIIHESDLDTRDQPSENASLVADPGKPDEQLTTNGAVPAPDGNPSDSEDSEESGDANCDAPSSSIVPAGDFEPIQPMSKNQIKKQRKREEWEAGRDYRKAKRKLKAAERKLRKKEAREEAANSTLDVNTKKSRARHARLPITILIDCGFDNLMAEKEMTSLGSQLTRSYSDNHRAPFQAHLAISSWGGLLKQRFDTVLNKHHLNWKDVRFEEDDFVVVAEKAMSWMSSKAGGKLAGAFGKYGLQNGVSTQVERHSSEATTLEANIPELQTVAVNAQINPDTNQHPKSTTTEAPITDTDAQKSSEEQLQSKGEIVYLTSDSPDTLTELKPYSTYIVGGLVDKNRHKGICYKTALDRGVKTAKLPIGEYMTMQSRFVLATNHVVEIMIRWLECGDWGEAFMQVIPKRKGGSLKEGDDEDDMP